MYIVQSCGIVLFDMGNHYYSVGRTKIESKKQPFSLILQNPLSFPLSSNCFSINRSVEMNIILQTHLKCAPFQIWMDHKKDLHSSWNQTHIWSPRSCQAKLLKFVWVVNYAPLLQLPETYTQVLVS